MFELDRVVVDLAGDDHVFFQRDHVLFRIAAAQPGRFINTQTDAVEAVEAGQAGAGAFAEGFERLGAGAGADELDGCLQRTIGFFVALFSFGRRRAAAEGAGEVAVVTAGAGDGGVADD